MTDDQVPSFALILKVKCPGPLHREVLPGLHTVLLKVCSDGTEPNTYLERMSNTA